MKHLPYENWILDEPELKSEEIDSLSKHLGVCDQCRQLKKGWEASKALLNKANLATPAPGFSVRWQNTIIQKCKTEKVRRYRITMFGLLVLTFLASVTYMVASGSFMQVLANFLNSIIQSVIVITHSLSNLGLWINRMPAAVPLAAGFFFFGLINAFLMSAVFFFWNLRNRKTPIHETALD